MNSTPVSRDEDEEDILLAMQLIVLRIVPYALKTAIELNLLEIIAKAGPLGTHLSPLDLASKAAAQNPDAPMMIDRLLRLLSAYSVCTCKLVKDEEGRDLRVYGLVKAGRKLIKDEDGFSLASTVRFSNPKFEGDTCSQLTSSILEGGARPYERVCGDLIFMDMEKNNNIQSEFNDAMLNHTSVVMKKILKTYNGFNSLSGGVLVDVGGGLGANLALILSRLPQLKGVNFDLPHVVSEAPKIKGVEHVGGNMFDKIPQGQAIFMKWILHDWNDDQCVEILKNCKQALPKNGKVIIVEYIIPREISDIDLGTKNSLCYDVGIMCVTQGGKERTKEEFEVLAMQAGFNLPNIIYGAYSFWIIELYAD
ncbi:caffeic acid 3-O-methyltransferase-like [Raphanus sativus]|uniref:Caffeic acid 3-O-methyltransferase-like n=1 Tax=Raphanus sativus TaxID=3726 RepID=A0A9W3C937_RAPSA|nr:caffeic acid 3-O-methyltransferase-like [Raphanus sativus]